MNNRAQYLLVAPLFLGPLGLFLYASISVITQARYEFQPEIIDSITYGITVSGVTATLSTVLGFLISFLAYRTLKTFQVNSLFTIVMAIPSISFVYLVYLLLSSTGLLSRLMGQLGWISDSQEFPLLINDELGFGIIFTYLLKEIPFVCLFLFPLFQEKMSQFDEMARTLGESTLRILYKVYLPILLPTLLIIWIILFAYTIGAFEVPFVLGANYPQMPAVYALEGFQSIDLEDANITYLLSNLCFFISLICAIVLMIFNRRNYIEEGE